MRKVQESPFLFSAGRRSFALKRTAVLVIYFGITDRKQQIARAIYRLPDCTSLCNSAKADAVGPSAGAVSALSVISLRRNGISTTSTIPTARLPAPSSANNFAYPGLVATAVVPVGSGIIPEKSPAKSDARPVTSIQLPIITP